MAVLNRALEEDQEAVKAVFEFRAPANAVLCADETIQVSANDSESPIVSVFGNTERGVWSG